MIQEQSLVSPVRNDDSSTRKAAKVECSLTVIVNVIGVFRGFPKLSHIALSPYRIRVYDASVVRKRQFPSVIPSGNPPWVAGFRVRPWIRNPEVIHPKPYPTGAPHGALFYIPVSYATAALPFPVLAMQPVLIGRHMDA